MLKKNGWLIRESELTDNFLYELVLNLIKNKRMLNQKKKSMQNFYKNYNWSENSDIFKEYNIKMNINLAKSEIIHFVGIGGIGMSGLALIMNDLGFKIQGSDKFLNKNIERLKKNKIKFYLGHASSNIKKATILVISSAIKKKII